MSENLRIARAVAQGVMAGAFFAMFNVIVCLVLEALRILWPVAAFGFLAVAAATFLGATRPGNR